PEQPMTTPSTDPTAYNTAFNAWDRNDLDLPPAAVTETTIQSLPAAPRDLIALLAEPHRSFIRDACGPTYETLTFSVPKTTTAFDPTADILPPAADTPAGREAHAEAARYFHARPIIHLEVTGNDNGLDLVITLQIAHDPQASVLFTFLHVSD
ncbi:MAG: hypothetical protein WBG86_13560, partial [Polyangiales bacterium]